MLDCGDVLGGSWPGSGRAGAGGTVAGLPGLEVDEGLEPAGARSCVRGSAAGLAGCLDGICSIGRTGPTGPGLDAAAGQARMDPPGCEEKLCRRDSGLEPACGTPCALAGVAKLASTGLYPPGWEEKLCRRDSALEPPGTAPLARAGAAKLTSDGLPILDCEEMLCNSGSKRVPSKRAPPVVPASEEGVSGSGLDDLKGDHGDLDDGLPSTDAVRGGRPMDAAVGKNVSLARKLSL
mmetsp:Transcript_40625/g.96866  ORF Transcript_40625/g.96866 Transcript_40625/m.96866 type:complete len:236 (-) Transcript_40625:317-1024(-)